MDWYTQQITHRHDTLKGFLFVKENKANTGRQFETLTAHDGGARQEFGLILHDVTHQEIFGTILDGQQQEYHQAGLADNGRLFVLFGILLVAVVQFDMMQETLLIRRSGGWSGAIRWLLCRGSFGHWVEPHGRFRRRRWLVCSCYLLHWMKKGYSLRQKPGNRNNNLSSNL